jgi:ATP-binding cassette subfamily B protein
LIKKISELDYQIVRQISTAKILTNITSDVDAIKLIFSQGVVAVFSALILIVGAAISMMSINLELGLVVSAVIPLLLATFFIIFKSINRFFKVSQENIDKLNKTINESIVGAPLTKVLNSGSWEIEKFSGVNLQTKNTNFRIILGFASLIPLITIITNFTILAVVYFGGSSVIDFFNSLTSGAGPAGLAPGEYSAFFNYIATFIAPIFILGFVSSNIARSTASVTRINETLKIKNAQIRGTKKLQIKGELEFKKVSLVSDNKSILNEISFEIKAGSKTAIVGPTASGKSQIFNLIAGLLQPTKGKIILDGVELNQIDATDFYKQVALVFQDSIIFNSSLKENIVFSSYTDAQDLDKAVSTADLSDFIKAQADGLETMVAERGSSLSGGQKQRLTLARALAVNPKLLLLDDFTARVDMQTEKRILGNLDKNYPGITLISITQKIEPIKSYDKILLIMEGSLIAQGTHEQLLKESFEYRQIYNSQKTIS